MKKTTILIITIISLIVFLIGSFLFVKKARENRTWPFNSTLSNYFPKSIKNFGYKITNPDKIILETQDGKIAVYSDGGSIILFSKINKD